MFWKCSPVPTSSKRAQPQWTQAKPASSEYYVGIGTSRKSSSSHLANAKKLALEDLASEITVTISATSFLSSLEKDDEFKEQYVSDITTSVQNDLEGYELVDSWEDDQVYWVMYRLDKSMYYAREKLKRETAKNLAMKGFTRAAQAQKNGDISAAIANYLEALFGLKEYLTEDNQVFYGEGKIYLGNEIYHRLQSLLSQITPTADKQKISLERLDEGDRAIEIMAAQAGTSKPISALTLSAVFAIGKGELNGQATTDANGVAVFNLTRIRSKVPNQQIITKVDLLDYARRSTTDDFLLALVKHFRSPSALVTVNIQSPRILVSTSEKNLDAEISPTFLESKMKSFLNDHGFVFTSERTDADLHIQIEGNTTPHSDNQWFHLTNLNYRISITELKSKTEVYNSKLLKVQGRQDTYEKAGLNAYELAVEQLEKEILPYLVTEVL